MNEPVTKRLVVNGSRPEGVRRTAIETSKLKPEDDARCRRILKMP